MRPLAVALSAMEIYLSYDEGASLASVKAPMRLINADLWPTDLSFWRKHKKDVELAVMPGVGHFLMVEDPEEFNRLLRRAVRELAGARN
jgi:pimeloyl-ACP methyl ester carboxylesterase